MNDIENSSVQIFWKIQEIIPHVHIHSILHIKWKILRAALFSYSDQFKKFQHTLRFEAHQIRKEWFYQEFYSTILINSTNHATHRDSNHIAQEMNDSNESSIQLFW